MPRLLQVSIEVNSGSVGRIAEQIGEIVMKYGWDSYITYARNHLPSKSKTIKIGTKWDVYWHGIYTRIFDRHCFASTRSTKKLIRKIKEIKPDIIQLHHIHGYYLNMNVLFSYLSSIHIPVVWIFHDCWAITGHCAYFDYVGCDKWKTGCYECIQKKEYPASWWLDCSKENYSIKKRLFNSVNNLTIVPVSYWLGNIVKDSFLKHHKIKVIQNGIDLDIFSPKNNADQIKNIYGIGQRKILLGVASTWEVRKGLKDFCKLQKMIDPSYVIVLIGLNKQQIKDLPTGIIGIARTENIQKLTELYSAAEAFVNPTWEDTFPTTNLEAMACGTPVITYATGGSVESISPETGFIVKQGDVAGIWECVKKIENRGKGHFLKPCRERAEKLYNKKDRYEEYMNLYARLLNLK